MEKFLNECLLNFMSAKKMFFILLKALEPIKGVFHEIFDLFFFSKFESFWAPDKPAK